MKLKMLKKAMIEQVESVKKAVWSEISYPLSIMGGRNAYLEDYRIYGNTVQDGSPSPEAPAVIESVGELVTEGEKAGKYKISVLARGKNYFDLGKVPFSNTATQPYNNGLIATNLDVTNRGDRIPIDLPGGKKIYITLEVTDSQFEGTVKFITLDFLNSNKTRVTTARITSAIGEKTISLTPKESVSYIQFYFQTDDEKNPPGDYMTMDNIMISTDEDSSYEAYIKPKVVDIYLDEPLRKINECADYIDFKRNVAVRKNTKIVFDGSERWITVPDMTGHFYLPVSYLSIANSNSKKLCLSNFLKEYTWEELCKNNNTSNGEYLTGIARSAEGILAVPSEYISSLQEWTAQLKAWKEAGTPFVAWYVDDDDDENIILPSIPQFKGTVIYEIQTKVQPSGMEAFYYGEA